MQKLAALRQFVCSLGGVKANKLDAWTENLRLRLTGKHKGNGLALFEIDYTAIIDIEDWPHGKRPVQVLFAHVIAWLSEHDCDRDDLSDKTVSATPQIHDDDSADIELSLEFRETVELVEDPSGEIEAYRKRWTLKPVVIDVAERFTIESSIKK